MHRWSERQGAIFLSAATDYSFNQLKLLSFKAIGDRLVTLLKNNAF